MTPAAGLVLAAGQGRRFGQPKAPVVIDGERLVDRAVRVLREGGCDPIVVVLGAWVGDVPEADDLVINETWNEGMGSSLCAGLRHLLDSTTATRVVVTLVDLPGLSGEAVARLLTSTAELTAASYDGVRGHPVVINRNHWDPLMLTVTGDSGARRYLDQHDVTLTEVGDVASGDDLDEPLAD
ncbi:MAG: nucleotidyltransferase family protein [Actinomycetes bacterium]